MTKPWDAPRQSVQTEQAPSAKLRAQQCYRESHREILRKEARNYAARHYAENPEGMRQYQNAYNANNRKKMNEKARKRRETHRKILRAQQ